MSFRPAPPILTATALGLPALSNRIGAWNLPGLGDIIGGGGAGLAGALYVIPFWAGDNMRINAAVFEVSTLAAGSSTLVCLYSMNADGYPGTLQTGAALATVSTATIGVKVPTIGPIILTQGGYWLGLMCIGGTPAIRLMSAPSGGGGPTAVPWQSLGTPTGNPGQCDYAMNGTVAGLGDADSAPLMIGQIDAFLLADFDNTGRTVPPSTFGAYTGRVNSPATTDNGTVNAAYAVGLRIAA